MKTTALLGSLFLILGSGCDKDAAPTSEPTPEPRVGEVQVDTSSAKPAADNTERNEYDQKTGALTPGDQGESEADRELTRQVRQSVMQEDGLSMNAKNVKIITQNGVVTLRGPVDSDTEKSRIASLAQSASGAKRVDNQLQVAAP